MAEATGKSASGSSATERRSEKRDPSIRKAPCKRRVGGAKSNYAGHSPTHSPLPANCSVSPQNKRSERLRGEKRGRGEERGRAGGAGGRGRDLRCHVLCDLSACGFRCDLSVGSDAISARSSDAISDAIFRYNLSVSSVWAQCHIKAIAVRSQMRSQMRHTHWRGCHDGAYIPSDVYGTPAHHKLHSMSKSWGSPRSHVGSFP